MEVGGGCVLCPRRCGVERGAGYCGAPAELRVASVCVHRGEEPPLNPIVNVFFAHCNLQCIYCQNWQISESSGFGVRSSELFGCGSINSKLRTPNSELSNLVDTITSHLSPLTSHLVGFVTAAHYIDYIPAIVEEVRRRGYSPTVVYNSGGYESVEALRTLEGYVDIYLPDLKYMDSGLAARYSRAPDYPQVATEALLEMKRQVGGGLKMGDDGLAYRGMLVRHLVLPGAVQNAIDCLDWLADNMTMTTGISLMAQYFPPRAGLPSPLDRRLTQQEYDIVLDHLRGLPFTNVWTQELTAQDNYRPDFSRGGNPFER